MEGVGSDIMLAHSQVILSPLVCALSLLVVYSTHSSKRLIAAGAHAIMHRNIPVVKGKSYSEVKVKAH
jgi:cell division protein FtsL